MFNQIRRIWADKGLEDKDFTEQERKLRIALEHLKAAADSLSKATQTLLYVIRADGR